MKMDRVFVALNVVGIIVVAWINYESNKTTHSLVNSRMSEMLDLAKKNWREGQADEQERKQVPH